MQALAAAGLAVAAAGAGAQNALPGGEYSRVREYRTGFDAPRAIAVTPDGRIYAAGDRAVHIIGPSGDYASFPVPGEPTCAAISTNGLLYLGMRDHVEVVDHCGTSKARWKSPSSNSVITSVSVGGGGILVADAGRREVLEYSPAGEILRRIGGAAAGDTNSLVVPSAHLDAAYGAGGALWVANPGRHRMQMYSPHGTLVRAWGFFSHTDPAGFTGCCNPADFACLPDGSIVAADKGTLASVRLFSPDGRLVQVLADSSRLKARDLNRIGAGLDVAVDGNGRIYVLNPVTKTVTVFARKGR
jgi:hypothetical protein